MNQLSVVKKEREWTPEGYVDAPSHENYIEIYIIEANCSGDSEFMAFRSFETYNEDLLARASGVIDDTEHYINSEYAGKTADEADAEGAETCTGVPMGEMIRGLVVAKQALVDKNGELAAQAANDFMHCLLEADENIGFYKAFLYLT